MECINTWHLCYIFGHIRWADSIAIRHWLSPRSRHGVQWTTFCELYLVVAVFVSREIFIDWSNGIECVVCFFLSLAVVVFFCIFFHSYLFRTVLDFGVLWWIKSGHRKSARLEISCVLVIFRKYQKFYFPRFDCNWWHQFHVSRDKLLS